uniref:PNPLA domain-containing protein n=1 Tax=viral metagenome TaxID=1070528 RepID=A0A6C0CQE8_9ZZZZ
MDKYDFLHLGGGGSIVFAYIGTLSYLAQHKDELFVRGIFPPTQISATSAGTVVALLLILFKIEEMIELVLNTDNISSFLIFDLVYYEKTKNMFNIDTLIQFISVLLSDKGYDFNTLTFGDFYANTRILLSITGTSLTQGVTHFFNKISTPTMLIKQAIIISMCVPICFCPIEFDNQLFCDGAVITDMSEVYKTAKRPLFLFTRVQYQNIKNLHDLNVTSNTPVSLENLELHGKYLAVVFEMSINTILNYMKQDIEKKSDVIYLTSKHSFLECAHLNDANTIYQIILYGFETAQLFYKKKR